MVVSLSTLNHEHGSHIKSMVMPSKERQPASWEPAMAIYEQKWLQLTNYLGIEVANHATTRPLLLAGKLAMLFPERKRQIPVDVSVFDAWARANKKVFKRELEADVLTATTLAFCKSLFPSRVDEVLQEYPDFATNLRALPLHRLTQNLSKENFYNAALISIALGEVFDMSQVDFAVGLIDSNRQYFTQDKWWRELTRVSALSTYQWALITRLFGTNKGPTIDDPQTKVELLYQIAVDENEGIVEATNLVDIVLAVALMSAKEVHVTSQGLELTYNESKIMPGPPGILPPRKELP